VRARGRSVSAEPQDLSIFPELFVERLRAQAGDTVDELLASLASPPPGLRTNTLRLSPDELLSKVPFQLEPLPCPVEGFIVRGGPPPGKHPYHAAGAYYLQDPGAMIVGALVDPRPGERILDLAAAPGGKATHLAALMQGSGILIANDVHAGRARELAGNLERCGVRNAVVTSQPAARLSAHFGRWFDRVLLDAPCSGEAMFHKSEAARSGWSPAAVLGCAARQDELMVEAAEMVRPGGILVYSTCTFAPEEDEAVVARFLDRNADFGVVELGDVPGGEPGRPEWALRATPRPELRRTLRLWPHRVPGAGHYVAALRRAGGAAGEALPSFAGEASSEARRLWTGFQHAYLTHDPVEGFLLNQRAEQLFALPPNTPDFGRLTARGVWLGTVRKGRFDPAHSLAMLLREEESSNRVRLDANRPESLAYLRGEVLRSPQGLPGWVLVTVDGLPLGWGKKVGTTIKNHYPRGLRWPLTRR
jgi:NOL1/NOP2/sun family putative RNA methylase